MLENIVFTGKNSGFAATLKERVDAYFQTRGLSKRCNALMVAKTVFYLGGLASIYLILMSGRLPQVAMLGLAMIMGFFLAGIGFNIGHDANHGAYSLNPRVNKAMSYCFDLIGASSYTWRVRHNVLHHTYTNVVGSDGDLDSIPLLRFYVREGRRFFHRLQHWYAPFLYSFVTLVWVFKKDYMHILEERRGLHSRRKPPVSAYVSLIFFKLFHYTLFIVLPLIVLDLPVWKVAVGFLAMHFVAGLMLASVFQLAHVVEGPDFVHPTNLNSVEDCWTEHQLKTTSDFGPDFLTTWICGGLNYQIEHHLFPNICHVHYPAISAIVQETAKEFHLPYNLHKTFFSAYCSHLRMLKYFGRTDEVPVS